MEFPDCLSIRPRLRVSDLATFQILDSELEILNILMCLDIYDVIITVI